MSQFGSPHVDAVLVGGYNLVSYLTSIGSVRKAAVLEERTVLNDDWRKHGDTTLREYSMGPYEGWYDDTATSGIVARIDAELGTTAVVCELRNTNTIGKQFVILLECLHGLFGGIVKQAIVRRAVAQH